MKNMFIIVMAAMLGLMAWTGFADSSYLYWMVDVSETPAYSFSYATIKGVGENGEESGFLSLYDGSISSPSYSGTQLASTDADGMKTAKIFAGVDGYANVTDEHENSFLVELWAAGANDGDAANRIAYGYLTYGDVKGFVVNQMSWSVLSQPYIVTGAKLVPEPTSGLLMLFGFAALVLRRKQKMA
jgi:hypothetical protein